MGWYDSLKNFLESKLNITIGDISLIKVTIVKGSESKPVTYYKEENAYKIDLEKLNEKEYKQIKSQYKDYVEKGEVLLETKASSLLDELYLFKNKSNSTLEFFHEIISPKDFSALRASIFVREKFKVSQPINDLKRDIIMRFGDRGRNICNLCSAGYFEEFLTPLYNSDKKGFFEIYEDLVADSMLAVFVNTGMKAEDIPAEITKKIEISKKYGFKFIHIHGIGEKNINTIKEFIDSKKAELFNVEKIRYANPEKHIFIAELILA